MTPAPPAFPPRSLPIHDLGPDPEAPASFRLLRHEVVDLNLLAFYPHRHAFHEVMLVLEGQGRHVVDFTPIELDPPQLHFLSPGQVHFWDLETKPRILTILFTEEFLLPGADKLSFLYSLSLFNSWKGPRSLTLEQGDCPHFLALVEAMEEESAHSRFGRETMLRALLTSLLVRSERLAHPRAVPPEEMESSTLVRRFMRLAARRYDTERSVANYARALGVTPGHLADVVGKATGRSPGRIIRDQVLLEAKRLLAHSDMSVAEVGYHLAFEDPSYFGRFFRRETGDSPGEFRRRTREMYQLADSLSL